MKERYEKLYQYMAESKDPDNMRLFGQVMTEMMDKAIKDNPSFAEREIDKLEAMMWNQYLSRGEAEDAVRQMQPRAPWSYDVWQKAMQDAGLETSEDGNYNCYALWTVMNGIMSDSGDTFKKYGIGNDVLLPMVHDLALDLINDEDERFDVRMYYLD
jgi:hypothetical protein